jgi:hypothetical protein
MHLHHRWQTKELTAVYSEIRVEYINPLSAEEETFNLYAFPFSPFVPHVLPISSSLNLITLIILGEEYKLLSTS